MKKYLLCLVCCLFGTMQAETALILQHNDGQQHTYLLSEQPRLTFASHTLSITSPQAQATFDLTDIQKFYFEEVDPGSDPLISSERRFAFLDGQLSIDGMQGTILLTDVSGHTLYHTQSQGQHVSIDLRQYPQGVYILRLGDQSIKLYR